MKSLELNEKSFSYNSVDDKDIFSIIKAIKTGIKFSAFTSIAQNIPFSLNEWAGFLNISERTMLQNRSSFIATNIRLRISWLAIKVVRKRSGHTRIYRR